MSIQVNGPRVLIKRLDDAALKSKLIEVIQYDAPASQFAVVIAVGNGKRKEDGTHIPLELKPGQVVITKPYTGMAYEYMEQDCVMVMYDDILAICEGL